MEQADAVSAWDAALGRLDPIPGSVWFAYPCQAVTLGV